VKGAVAEQEQLSMWFETIGNVSTFTGTGEWELVGFEFNGSFFYNRISRLVARLYLRAWLHK
jgi:hypothetical protein